ncbi:MAG: alpha/beta hydrolase [Clostridiales bacterium]|nr:alpha/beta hydrolase [Clostridiales bacterium]
MLTENIWKDGEYTYEAAYGFVPNLAFYLHEEDDSARPFMLVVPGGGYCMVVPPEAEVVAKEFYARGMNCAVLTYTTDITFSVPLKKQPLKDIARAVRYIRANKSGYCKDKFIVCGFSAGAHVCGTLGVHYEDVTDTDPELSSVSCRPDAMILCYPVITSGEYTHDFSMQALIGKDGPSEEYEYFSLEKNVTDNTPPTFLWQTVTDDLVPVENSEMFASALRAADVPYAYYAFPHGFHGLSVCNEAWFRGDFGEPYTMDQVMRAVAAVKEGRSINVSDARRQEIIEQFAEEPAPPPEAPDINDYKDVAMWPDLAMAWLDRI